MKRKNRKKTSEIEQTKLYVQEINYDKLAEAVVCATERLEEKKDKKKEEENNLQKAEWDRILKQKMYPENKKWLQRKLHQFRNEFMAYIVLSFFKEKNTRDAIATLTLIRLATETMFSCVKWILYFFSIMFIYSFCVNSANNVILLAFAFLAWTIARIIRIAVFEIKKMKDSNLILNIFSGSISFVALIVAIVAIVVSK